MGRIGWRPIKYRAGLLSRRPCPRPIAARYANTNLWRWRAIYNTSIKSSGVARAVIILQSAMPVAVSNYLFAQLYQREPEEVAGMVLIDAVVRLVPGVLGDERSNIDDSFSPGNRLLEFGQYTRPREYRGWKVPDVSAAEQNTERLVLLCGRYEGFDQRVSW